MSSSNNSTSIIETINDVTAFYKPSFIEDPWADLLKDPEPSQSEQPALENQDEIIISDTEFL